MTKHVLQGSAKAKATVKRLRVNLTCSEAAWGMWLSKCMESSFYKIFFKPSRWLKISASPPRKNDKGDVYVTDAYPYNRMRGPSSILTSNVEEMSNYLQIYLNNGIYDGNRILTANPLKTCGHRRLENLKIINHKEISIMPKVDRRKFLTITAATASMAIALKGKNALAAVPNQKINTVENFDVESQIDPWIELDLDALKSNVKEVRRKIGNRPIMAIVKCNAYGHGMIEIATALQKDNGVNHFAVVKVKEATDLRDNGIEGMILNMGPFNRAGAQRVIDLDISQSVFSDAVTLLNDEAVKMGKIAKVHICIDTGLGRVGVPHYGAGDFIDQVAALSNVKIEGLFTAMTEDDDMNPTQVARLNEVYDAAKSKGIDLGLRHCASSAEVDRYPYTYLDMVRPGNCLVGLEPERQLNMDIKQVMTFKTRVMFIKDMKPGETIGYHQFYKIDKPTKIATLPLGYSDGYPPTVANKADVLIKGRRYPVVAMITANHTLIDISGADDIEIGDEVVLWGRQGDQEISKVELELHAPNATNAYRMAVRLRTYLPRVTS